jgi:hypothetical protein
MVQKVACANGKGMKKTSKMRPKSIRNSMTNQSQNHVCFKQFFGPPFSYFFFLYFQKWSILGPSSKSDGVKNPLRVRGRTQQSVSGWFSPVAVSLSCTAPYLTSPFLLLSHWVSVSAGHPAIADARKVGVLGAADFQMSAKIDQNYLQNCCFFFNFSKNHENQENIVKPMVF